MHSITSYANDHHRAEVIELWTTVFGYESAHNAPGVSIDKKLEAHDDLFFVALLEGAVIGTILAGYDGHRGWLYSVAVHPSHRKKGLGRALVGHAERTLTERGCMKINLQIAPGNEAVSAFWSPWRQHTASGTLAWGSVNGRNTMPGSRRQAELSGTMATPAPDSTMPSAVGMVPAISVDLGCSPCARSQVATVP